jgi:hypothetical protein
MITSSLITLSNFHCISKNLMQQPKKKQLQDKITPEVLWVKKGLRSG